MNTLYGRFGMNPESTVMEVCREERYLELIKKENFQSAEKLTDDYYLVNYMTNSRCVNDEDWKAPRLTAVQLSAAITAMARIYMYPFISRSDCFYTDTDSIVIGNPLPDECVSSTEIGKFKLENKVSKGFFLAPKTYMLDVEDDRHIIKHKGPAKDVFTSDWFVRQFQDLSQTKVIQTSANFRIDWSDLNIRKKPMMITQGFPKSTKRENIYDKNNVWINTRPIEVIDLGTKDATFIFKLQKLKDEKANEEAVSQSSTEEGTVLDQPTQYKSKREAKNPRKNRSHSPTSLNFAHQNRIKRRSISARLLCLVRTNSPFRYLLPWVDYLWERSRRS